ncbi:Retrovirus-related Pol polyprotein from transposon 17.6,Retrovirus-related Pol polyprotein from transposon 297 [Mytilus edulis]|uniref:Retrovirus-related Pol polyprotein from transposon 17.6,Retrovirus-related Pol polyprotein from transposon 297 n=1 Tax=Mytilus edulis TaxID=6550 RepID=A0A8S3SGN7_MYTED|nr:Retrovirus-related Pol polyprotein from transposon 17.6,Retrovirus-related Pol polyprotein from transposon 297 [Mytilus edulis]
MSDSESEVTIQNQPEPDKNSAEKSASQTTPTQATVNSEHFEILMNNISHMAKTFQHGSKSSTPGFSIDSFAGLPTEDANLWLDKFDAWIAFHGWNKENEKIASAMRLKLEGGALSWFNGLPNSVKRNSDTLFTKFKEHFSGLHPTWMLEQHLYERCMLPSESLEVYISDIEKRCSRLCKTDRETTTAFIRGLPGSLRVFVIQRDPKYFKDAVQSARLAQESMAGLTSTFEYGASNSVLNKLSDQEKAIKDLKDTISAMQISNPRINKSEYKVECQLCTKTGHSAKDCRSYSIQEKSAWTLRKRVSRILYGKLKKPNNSGRLVRPEGLIDPPSPIVSDSLCTVNAASLINNYIKISIDKYDTFALIDTGADISVANPSLIGKLRNIGVRVNIDKSDKDSILIANNEKVKIIGVISVNIVVGKENAHVRFYLVPGLEPNIILGIDFLKSKGAVIDFVNRKVTFDPRRQLVAQTDVTVPPMSEKLIVAKIKGTPLPDLILGISTESPVLASHSLLAAKSLSEVRNGTVAHGLCNLTDKPITIKKNSNVGKFVCLSNKDKVFVVNESKTSVSVQNTPIEDEGAVMNEILSHIGHDLNDKERDQMVNLLESYSNVFVNGGKLGNCDILQHEISMPCDQKPIRQRPYKIGNKQKQILENMIEDMLKQDIIEPSTSPWAAPCLLVAKKNNSEYRFVVDYRKINSITEQDAHPFLTTDDALESLGATQPSYFSCLDLRSGFYQTQISPKSRPYTAWRCHLGLFQFKRLPMGLKNSPQMFQRLMETVLRGMTFKFCLIYLDDIIVFSKTFNEHIEHLRDVFVKLRDAGLKLHPQKCSFAQREINYLGHKVSNEGIAPDKSKIDAITQYPVPRKLKDLRAFLGLSGYYRKFVQNYAKIAAPLYALTKKNCEFVWSKECDKPTGKFARWVALIQSYNFEIVYRPGSSHGNADGVSRRTYVDSPDDDLNNESLLNILPSYQIHETHQLNTKESSNPIFTPPVRKIACQSVKQCRDIHINADNLFSTTEIKSEQRADNNYKDIIDYLETGRLPKDKDKHRKVLVLQPFYFLHDDILYHVDKRSKRGQRDLNANIQLAIPRKMVPTILAETHNSLFSGHLGISRTIRRTQRLYFWPLMNSDIENWIKSCELCSERKQPSNPVRAQLSSMPLASMPFERVSTDIMGPLPYVEFIPLSDIRASTVAKAFIENVLCRHGSPSFLHSDRGSNYLSNIVRETCKLFEITKTHTTSYHPQCNGQSERMMRSVKDMLSKYLDDNKNWHNFLPFIQFAYNTAPSVDTTDYSPFFLVYGRHPKNPIDSNLPNLDVNKTAQEYVTTLLEELEIARKIAKELIEIRKAEMLKKANKNRDNPNFNVGDIVYLYKPVLVAGIGRKLNRPWIGPYYISQKLSEIHVKLRRKSDGKLLKNRVHINRLKRGYVWTNEPYDITPPLNEDAVEPAIISVDETPADFISEEVQPNLSQSQDNATQNNNSDNAVFSVEKILRKKRIKGKWKYRVKWVGFDSKDNSWVDFGDLNLECQKYVTDMHNKIPSVRR